MSDDVVHRSRQARAGRLVLLALAAALVAVPVVVGLVAAWRLHPLLVVPAYLVGIPVWLSLLAAGWGLVSRLRRTPGGASESATELPAVRTELRLPLPRGEQTEVRSIRLPGAVPRGVRTPTP